MWGNTIFTTTWRISVFIGILIFSLAAVSAAQWSATQDGYTVTADDVSCTGSKCWIETEVCNELNQSRVYNVSFFSNTVEPLAIEKYGAVLVSRNVYVHSNVTYINTTTNQTQRNTTLDRFVLQKITEQRFVPVVQNRSSRLGRNAVTALNNNYAAYECRTFQVQVANTLGVVHKYDVNFLDPFINATYYEVGSLSNNSNTWDVDVNTTTSTADIGSDNTSVTLGIEYGVTDAHNQNMYLGSNSGGGGFVYVANQDLPEKIVVDRWDGVNATNWYLEYRNGSSIASNLSNTNEEIIFYHSFSQGDEFRVWTHLDGSAYYSRYLNTSCTFPVAGTYVNITTGWHNGLSVEQNTCFNIESITFGDLKYNVSDNLYESTLLSLGINASSLQIAWEATLNGGSVSVNATCNADEGSPQWTGSVISGFAVQCPVEGDAFMYQITLTGNTTDTPVVHNLSASFLLTANETEARQAIMDAVDDTAASGGTYYADQQLYVRLGNGTQVLDTYDYFLVAGAKRYAFNYEKSSSTVFTQAYNISPVLYVWQTTNLSIAQIYDEVKSLVDDTY